MLKITILTLLFNLIANWIQFYYLGKNLLNPTQRKALHNLEDESLRKRVNDVTGLDLKIRIMDENLKAIGFMMTSPPFAPVMIFSKKLISLFNESELEWVILHEAGHYLMSHNLKLIILDLILSITNAILIFKFNLPILTALVYTACLALAQIQIAKIFEYQADRFAASKMTNPQGMITGNKKMRMENKTFSKSKFLRKLLVIAVPYEKRIEMAKKEIMKRKNSLFAMADSE